MVDAGSYVLSALAVAFLVACLGFAAHRLRRRLIPSWHGPPALLAEAIVAIALLVWLATALGLVGLLYAWSLLLSAAAFATLVALLDGNDSPAGGAVGGDPHSGGRAAPEHMGVPTATGPAGRSSLVRGFRDAESLLMLAITVGVVAILVALWGLTIDRALERGMFNFDSLWYHMPFAVEFAQSHSVTGFHHPDTVYANWFYPQNSELLHSVAILLGGRDTLSLFLNLGWLGVALLAAWCVGRPYGRGPLCVAAAAIVLGCHTLVVREPGAAKNDAVAAALILASLAVLIEARAAAGTRSIPVGWPLAIAGLACGLAAGTKVTALAMAAALTVAVVVLAPAGSRRAAFGWWFLPAFAAGGFWYLRNLVAVGNPLPQVKGIGPISLPHPEQLQSGRPDFSIVHYATDTGVWREYFGPGLDQAFGALWPLLLAGAVAGAVLALARGGDRVLRGCGAAVLVGLVAYLFTPLGASGAEGAPEGFAINIRFVIPALLAGIVLLPLALPRGRLWQWGGLAALLLTFALTDRVDAVARDPGRLFGALLALLLVLIPAALGLFAWAGGRRLRAAALAGAAALVLAVVAIGYPLQRDYLEKRFGPGSELPGMDLNSSYHWARDLDDARIGLAGTSAGFLGYGFYGTELSNRVVYLGEPGPHGAFNAIPDCAGFRRAVNEADLDYLVTAPFLNFLDPGSPIASPEAGWLRGEPAVTPIRRSGRVTVWRIDGELDPAGCGQRNEPLRLVPDQPL